MVRTFDHTWVTDWQIAPRSFSITNGMTMALPPETVDRYIGMGQAGQRTAELDFQARQFLFAHATVSLWLYLRDAKPNPVHLDRIRHAVELHKGFVRPFQPPSRI
jgi:alpha-galactosidase